MTVPVIGLGAGGHAKVLIEALRAAGGFDIVALLDPAPARVGTSVLGVTVVGGDELLERQYDDGVRHAFIGLGGADDTVARVRLYELACAKGFDILSILHPSAVISPSAKLGRGATVLARAVIGAETRLGENVTVNTAAVVEHDSRLGDHVHVATGALLASGVAVGTGAHVGIGACVRQGIGIGARSVVGAGAVVVEDVEPDVVVVGVPARVLRRREHHAA